MIPSNPAFAFVVRTLLASLCLLGMGRLDSAEEPAGKPTIFVLGDSGLLQTASHIELGNRRTGRRVW